MAKIQIGVRLPVELIKAVDLLAEEELRDRTNAVEWVLLQWFREHRPDLLTADPPPRPYRDELGDRK